MIQQTNPKANYLAHKQEIDDAIRAVLDSGWYILGKQLKAFEEAFARYVGCAEGIGVANGTDAIELALRGCGVGAGDVVFTVSHTAVATVVGVERSVAAAVLVDIDPASFTMDPQSLEKAVATVKTAGGHAKAVVVVHLYGQIADMSAIGEIARREGLMIIEDCAQAHGATVNGTRAGANGRAAAFSFYPTKNPGAIGDGGFIATSDPEVAQRCRMLREYGWRERYVSEIRGVNSRLDELQAAILHAKLKGLDTDNARRQEIAARYTDLLRATGLRLPVVRPGHCRVFHQYVVRCAERDALREHLKEHGVGTLIHYPQPVHLQPAYRDRLRSVVPLAETEKAAREVLSLPMYPELGDADVAAVAEAVKAWRIH